jgi:hypothetical protein
MACRWNLRSQGAPENVCSSCGYVATSWESWTSPVPDLEEPSLAECEPPTKSPALQLEEDEDELAAARAIPSSALTLEDLKLASLPPGNSDWECSVCMFPYDNAAHVPFLVDASFEKKPNDYADDPEEDDRLRITKPGCGHAVCEPCSVQLLTTRRGSKCPLCRAWVKSFAPHLQLLETIVSEDGGRYVALVRQLNEMSDRLDPLQTEVCMVAETKRKHAQEVQRLTVDQEAWQATRAELATMQTEKAGLWTKVTELQRLVETLSHFRDELVNAKRSISEKDALGALLFEEFITSRLKQVAAGTLAPSQLGIEVMSLGTDDRPVTYKVSLGRGTPRYYIRPQYNLHAREEKARARIIANYNAMANATSLPTAMELEQSHFRMSDTLSMVKTGTWLQTWLSRNMGAETLFDAEGTAVTSGVDLEAHYVPATHAMLNKAKEEYKRLKAEAAAAPKPAQPLLPTMVALEGVLPGVDQDVLEIDSLPSHTAVARDTSGDLPSPPPPPPPKDKEPATSDAYGLGPGAYMCICCGCQASLCSICTYAWCDPPGRFCAHRCIVEQGSGGPPAPPAGRYGEQPERCDYYLWIRNLCTRLDGGRFLPGPIGRATEWVRNTRRISQRRMPLPATLEEALQEGQDHTDETDRLTYRDFCYYLVDRVLQIERQKQQIPIRSVNRPMRESYYLASPSPGGGARNTDYPENRNRRTLDQYHLQAVREEHQRQPRTEDLFDGPNDDDFDERLRRQDWTGLL